MAGLAQHLRDWRNAIAAPRHAGTLVLEARETGFAWFLALTIALLYATYGFGMGLYRCDFSLGIARGAVPALASAVKLPVLYLLGLCICFAPLYVLNCLYGPQLRPGGAIRLLLLATSANAIAIASYVPFSLFFTLTTSRSGYTFLVGMHVAVFVLAGAASLVVAVLIFRATAAATGNRLRPGFILAWGGVYATVMAQLSWVLRPWIGSWNIPYTAIRPRGGTFWEAVLRLITN